MSIKKRRDAAREHEPENIRLLLVAEAPPCDPERYFYYPKVKQHDWLYRYTWQALSGEKPVEGEKPGNLKRLRDAGVFVIDLHEDEIAKPKLKDLVPCVPGLVGRVKKLTPDHIVLIKASVYDAAYEPLRAAGFPVIDERVPFPASGQQKKFVEAFARAADTAEVTLDAAATSEG